MFTDNHFYPARGRDAFPNGCPCCGEVTKGYSPESTETVAYWHFACGCELILGDAGMIEVNDDCPEAMSRHLEGLVTHLPSVKAAS